MAPAFQLGPLVVSIPLVMALCALALGALVGLVLGRGSGARTGSTLVRIALIGAIVARLAFVWQWRGPYLEQPLAVLDLRDGGWSLESGFIAAALYGVYTIRQQNRLRWPVAGALVTAAAVFVAGELVMLARPGSDTVLPALSMESIDGRTVSLAAFAGKPVVVNLWASWCGPCRREMPLLQQAQHARPDVHFVFLNQGETAETVAAYLAEHQIVLRNVLLDRRLQAGAAFGQRALPTTLFFDAGGRLLGTRVGELTPQTLYERLGP